MNQTWKDDMKNLKYKRPILKWTQKCQNENFVKSDENISKL